MHVREVCVTDWAHTLHLSGHAAAGSPQHLCSMKAAAMQQHAAIAGCHRSRVRRTAENLPKMVAAAQQGARTVSSFMARLLHSPPSVFCTLVPPTLVPRRKMVL